MCHLERSLATRQKTKSDHTLASKYKKRPPFSLLQRIAIYELEDVDRLVAWSEQTLRSRAHFIEHLVPSTKHDISFVDDYDEMNAFARLYSECTIMALWRCVELYRKRAIFLAVGESTARNVFKNQNFIDVLKKETGVVEATVRCHRSVNELRCLNNAVKHEKRVGGELAMLPKWKKYKGEDIKDLLFHYYRLRPMAEKYINDLTARLNRRRGNNEDAEV